MELHRGAQITVGSDSAAENLKQQKVQVEKHNKGYGKLELQNKKFKAACREKKCSKTRKDNK